ncbi:HTTM domain-containing protein [Natronorubrum halophilum]|uniref:HTTM domain-containing protein n=1 Tax=Natronorubrum halophilum TaxID=1702106 RepID=UPI0010C17BAB|nr:HTTM domain-containing protein [Natronorubrum halophilum]
MSASRPGSSTDRDRRTVVLDLAREAVGPRLGIDRRALGAFRIALGLVLLVDLLVLRVPGLVTFYTDDGVFPRSTLAEAYPTIAPGSIHAVSGSAWFQGVLFAIAGAFAVLLLVGYRTRVATLCSFVLLASLHARNPHVINGGDTILLSFLLFGLFLPLSARWSLDARRRSVRRRSARYDAERGNRVLSVATAAILLNVVLVYATNGLFKTESELWMNGGAVRHIFHLEQYLVLLGPSLAEYPTLLTAANWFWVVLLGVSPLLVVLTGRLRLALVAAFVAAHLGMAATMRLGAFPFVMVAGLILFLPPHVWDRLERIVSDLDLERVSKPIGGDGAGSERTTSAGTSALVTPRTRRGARVIGSGVVACAFVSILVWQAVGIGLVDTPSGLDSEVEDASWAFFAPNPPTAHSWYAVEAERESGETIDGLGGGEARLDRPPDAAETYPSTLWKRYGMSVRYADETQYEPAAAYLCERLDGDVERLTVYLVEQPVSPDGPVGEPTAHGRIEYDC